VGVAGQSRRYPVFRLSRLDRFELLGLTPTEDRLTVGSQSVRGQASGVIADLVLPLPSLSPSSLRSAAVDL
jgi:hypothetical protein